MESELKAMCPGRALSVGGPLSLFQAPFLPHSRFSSPNIKGKENAELPGPNGRSHGPYSLFEQRVLSQ